MEHARPTVPPEPHRRTFLEWLTYFVGAVAAVVAGVPIVGYLVGPLRKVEPKEHDLGPVSDFPLEETRLKTFANPLRQKWDGIAGNTGVYVRYLGKDKNQKDQFRVLAMNCTHLGCPVTWFPQSGLFMCPCHGGVYYENGDRASGPPPRELYHCVWRVEKGHLIVQAPRLPTLQDTLGGDPPKKDERS